jgi:hypothetical protein
VVVPGARRPADRLEPALVTVALVVMPGARQIAQPLEPVTLAGGARTPVRSCPALMMVAGAHGRADRLELVPVAVALPDRASPWW